MTKQDYLNVLALALGVLPAAEVKEIVADYEEHFAHGLRSGKSEDQIIQSLGNPKFVAAQYLTENLSRVNSNEVTFDKGSIAANVKTLARVVALLLVLAPFNFFVLLVPFALVVTLGIVGWGIPTFSIVGGFTGIIALAMNVFGHSLFSSEGLTILLLFLGLIPLGFLFGIVMWFLTKQFLVLTVNYLKWNFRMVASASTGARPHLPRPFV